MGVRHSGVPSNSEAGDSPLGRLQEEGRIRMNENPPGYEAEQPIDLTKPVIYAAPVGSGTPKPEHNATAHKPGRDGTALQSAPAEAPEVAKPQSPGVVAVINLQPRSYKSVVAQRLYRALARTCEGVQLRSGTGRTESQNLVVVDMPSDVSGRDWRRQSSLADLLVIPVPDDIQAVRAAWWLLDQLAAAGRDDLVSSAVVVVIRTGRDRKLARRTVRHLRSRTAKVVRVDLGAEALPDFELRRWQPLAAAVLRQLRRRVSNEAADAEPAAGTTQVGAIDVRDYGKAMS